MGLFGDLPAVRKDGSGPRFESEAELEAQLAKLKQGTAVSSEESDDEEEGEAEEEEEEEAAPRQDLRRRPRSREEEHEETGGDPQQRQQQQEQQPQQQRKRVRIHEDVVTEAHEAPAPQQLGADEVGVALRRIAAHISNPSKFAKACPLLRKLLDGEALSKAPHQADLFQAIRAAFTDPATCAEPLLKREYMKLVAAIASRPDMFGRPEKAHLDIYRLVGHVQNELATDDSFSFNKALGRIREAMEELVEATAEDDAVLASLSSRGQGNAWAAAGSAHEGDEQRHQEQLQRLQQEHAKQVKSWEDKQQRLDHQQQQQQEQQQLEEGEQADPFGLDTLMAMEAKPRRSAQRPAAPSLPPPPPAPTTAWNAQETACMRREAVLQCLQTSRGFHKNAWARTGVELLIEQCYENRARFCGSQLPVLEDLMTWVKQQRTIRKQGPSAKEINRDSTSFERARAEWSKVAVSHRGKVGGGGDSKSNNWLG